MKYISSLVCKWRGIENLKENEFKDFWQLFWSEMNNLILFANCDGNLIAAEA